MTSTSVKSVSTVRADFVSNASNNVGTNTRSSFQEVWNNQTKKDNSAQAFDTEDKRVSRGDNPIRQSEKLKMRDAAKAKSQDEVSSENVKDEALDERKLEEAMEALNTVAQELLQEIADTFGMSMEELEQLMADMNMDAVEVLEPGKLSALLLEAGGAPDSLALLMDENLCGNFQMLMNRQKELVAEISEELQMTSEQLTKLVQEMDVLGMDKDEMPVIGATDATETQVPQITVETEREAWNNEEAEMATQNVNVRTEEAVNESGVNVQEENGQEKSGDRQSDTSKEQSGNLLLQNLKADSFNAEMQQVNSKVSTWSEATQDIMRQIMDYMKIQVKADTSNLEMQLHPASLGTLQIHVASKGGVLTANFITQNEAVKAALESQMVQLKESFAEQGVKVEAIEVTVQTHQFESNLEQGRGRQSGETEKKGRTRRINLNIPDDMEDVESMTPEEQMTADMMTANGNTVDYTA